MKTQLQPFATWDLETGIQINYHPDAINILERNDNKVRNIFEYECHCSLHISEAKCDIELYNYKEIYNSADDPMHIILEEIVFDRKVDPNFFKLFSEVDPEPMVEIKEPSQGLIEKVFNSLASLIGSKPVYFHLTIDLTKVDGLKVSRSDFQSNGNPAEGEADLIKKLKDEYQLPDLDMSSLFKKIGLSFLPTIQLGDEPISLKLKCIGTPSFDDFKRMEAMEWALDYFAQL